jgi:hypothetical protein
VAAIDGSTTLGFDPDVLREKYQRERDKRLRPDGAEQYLEVAGRYARFADEDPVNAGAVLRRIRRRP